MSGRAHPSLGLESGTGTHLEPDLVIEHREALIFLLYQAAEIEHGSMCQYLYAAFSLRRPDDPGLTAKQRTAIDRWREVVNAVASEEMLHLALVSNLLTAIGAAPNFGRPQLPHPARHYPPGVHLALIPFSERALRHFLYLERPEGVELEDSIGGQDINEALAHAQPAMSPREIVPRSQQFATVGHLYRAIEAGLEHLSETLGEDGLFVGPPRAQAGAADFRWKEVRRITDLQSAKAALELIVDQGEGARGDWRTAHFGRFYDVLQEYLMMRGSDPGFQASRPVLVADVRPAETGDRGELITDPLTADVVDLFNVTYEIMLQVLARYFTHTQETSDQLSLLADVALGLMMRVMKPLGELIPDLPVGPDHPRRTAGPSFELFYTSGYHLPHQHAAWLLLQERLRLAARLAGEIELPVATRTLAGVAETLGGLADRLHAARDAPSPAASSAPNDEPHIMITGNGPYVISGGLSLREQAIATDTGGDSVSWEALRTYETDERYALCRCGHSQNKPFCDGSHAHVGFDGTETASRRPFAQDAELTDGPTMELSDDRPLCAFARFCDGQGGIWKLTGETDQPDKRELVAHQASHCPSGRLVVHDKQHGGVLEPDLEPSIVLIEDPQQNASGPIWVRGGVTITSADGSCTSAETASRCAAAAAQPTCRSATGHTPTSDSALTPRQTAPRREARRALHLRLDMSKTRVEAFSDGVLAVAITLLVLNLHVPDPARAGSLAQHLGEQWPSYAAYVVSFLTIGIIWINCHAIFRRLVAVDHSLLVLNLILLLTVTVLPFSTALMAQYVRAGHGQALAAVIYGASYLAISLALLGMQQHLLFARPHLLAKHMTPEVCRSVARRGAFGTVPYLLGTLGGIITSYLTLIIGGAVALFYALPSTTADATPGVDVGVATVPARREEPLESQVKSG